MNIYIGTDHRGFNDISQITDYLRGKGYEVIDVGNTRFDQSDDFPVYAFKVVQNLLNDQDNRSKGILLCGSGQGMVMAANRFKGIRASICWDENEAYSSRHDDDANVLCLSADKQSIEDIKKIIDVWFSTNFADEDRFIRRIKELDNLDSLNIPD